MVLNFRKFLLYDVRITHDEKWDEFQSIVPSHGNHILLDKPAFEESHVFLSDFECV